jgi:hypothetical protein
VLRVEIDIISGVDRAKDIDFERGLIVVRADKGDKARVTIRPRCCLNLGHFFVSPV